jgi:hypothetical protein
LTLIFFTEENKGNKDGNILERPTSKERNGENDLNHGWTRINMDEKRDFDANRREFTQIIESCLSVCLTPPPDLLPVKGRRNSRRMRCSSVIRRRRRLWRDKIAGQLDREKTDEKWPRKNLRRK